MSEFYDEYTDDEEPTIEVSNSFNKYQKMIDEILENTKDLATTTEQLNKTEETLSKVKVALEKKPTPTLNNAK